MSDLNLMRYYLRLESLEAEVKVSVTLPEIAELLFTSLRHARTLLGKMHQEEWIIWEPKPGRNQRSNLTLRYSMLGLKQHIAAKFIEEGKYEKALSILDGDRSVFGSLLQETSGATMREGLLHVQLTYKRKFEDLFPHHIQRSSERFLLRQVFSCLASCNSEGKLEPELAHHWQYDSERYLWIFYLRPGLTFHDGQTIEAKQLVALFNALKELSFYQAELEHVESVYSEQPLQLCFKLSKADKGFAGLLAGVKYSIQPVEQVTRKAVKAVPQHKVASQHKSVHQHKTAPQHIIGTGPFRIVERNHDRLKLAAFDHYYGCRSLTDEVTIWQFEESMTGSARFDDSQMQVSSEQNSACFHQLGKTDTDLASSESDEQYSRVEDGCLFILFNQTTEKVPLTHEQRKYLAQIVSSDAIQSQLEANKGTFSVEYADNILPKWQKIHRSPSNAVDIPKQLSIAVYDYYALYRCAISISDILKRYGVEVEVNTYSYRELAQRSQANELTEDLVLCNLNLDDNAPSSLFSWLMNDPVLHSALGPLNSDWLKRQLDNHKASVELSDYLERLEPIASTLVSDYWLLPMFHHLQTVRFQGILKNVAITNWGWPEFKGVWSTD
ncbi:SgrR family transcriptional regulator [Vibrio gallaecicus]|uniref:SgrR family transcriptional regulator n=1 Tax=Vibrio gallaecicus TaxID=552386 RepID=UPI0010C97FAA|nr:SgrR family transcriptional regulator [Vibrio gallaecicus]MDN3615962.1 SgrR family transcriptional regulator [Vibrio gallaecicus]